MSISIKVDHLFLLIEYYYYLYILLLPEHWLEKINIYVHIPNYNLITIFCREPYEHGGTVILIHYSIFHTLESKTVDYSELLEEKQFGLSIISILILIFMLYCIYRSPNAKVSVF